MDIVHPCCAGLDVHKKTVVACVRRLGPDGSPQTSGPHLRHHDRRPARPGRLARRRGRHPRRHGIDRRLLEARLPPPGGSLRADAGQRPAHQAGAGRKTDVKDAEWIAQLLQHGLLSPSFVPPPPIRELRDLTRQRTQLIRDRATVANRIQKVLEDANIKLASVASDVAGRLGPGHDPGADRRARTTPTRWPSWRGSGCGARSRSCRRALHGRVTDHHRFLLRMLLDQVESPGGADRAVRRADRGGDGPFRRGGAAAADDPGGRPAVGRGDRGGDRHGHDDSSRRPVTWRRGRGCARATTRAPASVGAGGRPRGASGSARRWCRWRGRRCIPRRRSSARPTAGWAKRLGKKKALVAVGHKILGLIHKLLSDEVDYAERLGQQQAA